MDNISLWVIRIFVLVMMVGGFIITKEEKLLVLGVIFFAGAKYLSDFIKEKTKED